jgi:hypothetical protein
MSKLSNEMGVSYRPPAGGRSSASTAEQREVRKSVKQVTLGLSLVVRSQLRKSLVTAVGSLWIRLSVVAPDALPVQVPVTTGWCVLRLRMEETVSRHGG